MALAPIRRVGGMSLQGITVSEEKNEVRSGCRSPSSPEQGAHTGLETTSFCPATIHALLDGA